MKILHYSLGFPPFRTGGMTKYCIDLMKAEKGNGHEVGLMWPGHFAILDKSTLHIKKHNAIEGCFNYELVNPMPVPLLDGIKDIEPFIESRSEDIFLGFFKKNSFDVLHVHTLMGLPKECIIAAKKANVRTVFTSHDYFGLCPKCSFMFGDIACKEGKTCIDCTQCNKTALSQKKIELMQSALYKQIKQLSIIKKLRRRHIQSVNASYQAVSWITDRRSVNQSDINKYARLRQYYVSIFEQMDVIHFNSNNTRKIFEQYFDVSRNGTVVTISNGEIEDRKALKKGIVQNKEIRIGYLGPQSIRKGFFELVDCLDALAADYKNFKLVTYSGLLDREYAECHEPYSYSELPNVMHDMDFLVVPSKWNETFGFTVLEAFSYGIPAIVSDTVGAKDLIQPNCSGFIYRTQDELQQILKKLFDNPEKIQQMNRFIVENVPIKTMIIHEAEIEALYKGSEQK
ncbi:glycosyltransferase [Pseudobacteroides cellulosolvens]|uniref:Glycosyl transferase group 1 n=1 Tax=Pseudobacteroides cellulosolvens ATCC 35603 = DSM 2933 TaxID=398512 RepID=A0A0L6JLD9_9FIRM|nr:glycosyltransferase [Pseudobacteroides cellulosolvens]KNY26568.1 glycosyl transferase group 1 [Pseudobacteroides cellulosolvens ATCC 35603 = DSM 2933]